MAAPLCISPRKIFTMVTILYYVNRGCADVLINEINADNPGSPDVTEYLELRNTDHCGISMDGAVLSFYAVNTDGVPTLYSDESLENLCIPGNGYFLLGPSSLSVQVDLEINGPDFIQNGNGVARGVVLYKNIFSGSAPITLSTTKLVDVVVYDRLRSSNTSGFMPAYFPSESHVWEDSDFLSEDESISRCTGEAVKMSAFVTTPLSPKAPNPCQPDRITRWPSPCGDGSFPDVQRERSFLFQIQKGYKGTDTPLHSLKVKSLIECSRECFEEDMCTYLSYSVTADHTDNCLLYDSCRVYQTLSSDWLVAEKFYKMSPRNPVWPHDVLI